MFLWFSQDCRVKSCAGVIFCRFESVRTSHQQLRQSVSVLCLPCLVLEVAPSRLAPRSRGEVCAYPRMCTYSPARHSVRISGAPYGLTPVAFSVQVWAGVEWILGAKLVCHGRETVKHWNDTERSIDIGLSRAWHARRLAEAYETRRRGRGTDQTLHLFVYNQLAW